MKQTAARKQDEFHELASIVKKYRGREGVLIQALQEVQEMYGFLSRELLIRLAYELDVPLSEIYSVVSFYALFKTEPVGRCHLEVCGGTACYVNGMRDLLEYLEEEYSLRPGDVTGDGKFSLSTVNCVGACSASPVVKIGEEIFGEVTGRKLQELLERYGNE